MVCSAAIWHYYIVLLCYARLYQLVHFVSSCMVLDAVVLRHAAYIFLFILLLVHNMLFKCTPYQPTLTYFVHLGSSKRGARLLRYWFHPTTSTGSVPDSQSMAASHVFVPQDGDLLFHLSKARRVIWAKPDYNRRPDIQIVYGVLLSALHSADIFDSFASG